MIAISRLLVRTLASIALGSLLVSCAPAEQRGPVVLAAASLQGAMEEAADAWQERGHGRPVLSFAGTPALARQVEAGAPADIFVSADEQWMDQLDGQGLLRAGSRVALLGNRLVLVGSDRWSGGLWLPPGSLAAMSGGVRIAMADSESVPAGRYARAALEELGEWTALEDRLVMAENVRAALALVERGETELGIVYASDHIASEKVALIGTFPPEAVPPIVYPAALLAGSRHDDAQDFLAYLGSAEARAIFREHGFAPLP